MVNPTNNLSAAEHAPVIETSVHITELDCAAEEQVLRRLFDGRPGVHALTFDFLARRMLVKHDPQVLSTDAIAQRITSGGMTPRIDASSLTGHLPGDSEQNEGCAGEVCSPATETSVTSWRERASLAGSGLLAALSEALAWTYGSESWWPVITLALAAIALGGLPTLRKGFFALRTFTLNINFLMTMAVIGACVIGQWPEAAMVIFLFAVAELIERYSLERARNAVKALMAVTPKTAEVKQSDGSFQDELAARVPIGAIVRVRPGERLPLDGVVVSGESVVDQAPITGESIPVDKATGDPVFAGSINGNGALEFRTTGGADDTTIAQIVRTVQDAQAGRAPTQRFVDRFARVYTPVVIALAVMVAVVPPLAFGQRWYRWIYEALVLLVIACPCALVISTPVTVVSGLASAARRGILIKGGAFLEQGKRLRVIALDKTGTLTEGKPQLVAVKAVGTLSEDEVLRLAASLDAPSDHPVARAITAGWTVGKARALGVLYPVENFSSLTGRGVTGSIGTKTYFLGNHRSAHERSVCTPEIEQLLLDTEALGQTAVVLSDEHTALGVLAVADTARSTSIDAVRELAALGLQTLMLSGDNQRTVEAVAKAVGITEARGELLPEDKLAAIDNLLARHGSEGVGMVGDGVNDAPALARASVGFAMGAAGTDTALETADVALMSDDLRGVPRFIKLSRQTSAVLWQNITVALSMKALFFVLALLGVATLWMAVLADVGTSLLVIGNGLRLVHGSRRQWTTTSNVRRLLL